MVIYEVCILEQKVQIYFQKKYKMMSRRVIVQNVESYISDSCIVLIVGMS